MIIKININKNKYYQYILIFMADLLENQYDNDNFIDYYKILNIDIEATNNEIKTSYIKNAKKYHPDQENGDTNMFQLITKAYETLINKNNRIEYDLYYLKKSFNELQDDNFYNMRNNFNNFINTSNKKLTSDEIDKLVNDVFKDKENYKEIKDNLVETTKKLNDINLERESFVIENNNDKFKDLIDNSNININDIYDYIKESTKNNSNIISKLDNIDSFNICEINNYYNNYSLINKNENETDNYFSQIDNDLIINSKDELDKIKIDELNNWKQTRNSKLDYRLKNEEIELFLAKRKEEEEKLLTKVEHVIINNIKKRK